MQSTPAPACSSSQGLWGHFWAISTKLKCDPHVPRYPWAQREEVCLRSLHLIHLTQRHGQPAASPPAGPASIPCGDLKKRGNFSFLAACWYPMARHVTAPAAGAARELKPGLPFPTLQTLSWTSSTAHGIERHQERKIPKWVKMPGGTPWKSIQEWYNFCLQQVNR